MNSRSNILGKLKVSIVVALLAALALGTAGFMYYFRAYFARNLSTSVQHVTDSLQDQFQAREKEFIARKQRAETDSRTRLQQDIDILQQTLQAPLWNLEKDTAQRTLAAFLQKENLDGIRVFDDTGKFFVGALKQGGQPVVSTETDAFPLDQPHLTADILREEKKLGTVTVIYNDRVLRQQQALIDGDLKNFRAENTGLAGSIQQSLSQTVKTESNTIVRLRLAEMAACFIVVLITLTLFIRLGVVRPLRQMLATMSDSSAQIKVSATQVAQAAATVADNTSSEAASIEETSATVEEFASMTASNASHARETDKLMTETQGRVAAANNSMHALFESIQTIRDSSAKTSKIVGTIDAISFQTNILALNAAVEAARAGEHGVGFAVVAEEVRTLAQRAAEAAKNTAELIENTNRHVGSAAAMVEDAKKQFEQVSDHVGKSTGFVTQIAQATEEQSKGINQINTAIAEIDRVIQQTVASSEESAAASQIMTAQTGEMNQVIAQLREMIGLTDERPDPAAEESPVPPAGKKASPAKRPTSLAHVSSR